MVWKLDGVVMIATNMFFISCGVAGLATLLYPMQVPMVGM